MNQADIDKTRPEYLLGKVEQMEKDISDLQAQVAGRSDLINTVLAYIIQRDEREWAEDLMGKIAFDFTTHHLSDKEKLGWQSQQRNLLHHLSGYFGLDPLGGSTPDEI